MKSNTKSSITLPADELKLVKSLGKALGAKSNVEVVRRGLQLLKAQTDRDVLRAGYAEASRRSIAALKEELQELDGLTDEGLKD